MSTLTDKRLCEDKHCPGSSELLLETSHIKTSIAEVMKDINTSTFKGPYSKLNWNAINPPPHSHTHTHRQKEEKKEKKERKEGEIQISHKEVPPPCSSLHIKQSPEGAVFTSLLQRARHS